MFVLATSVFTVSSASAPLADAAAGCRIYVASGDDVTNGKAMNDNAKRYPETAARGPHQVAGLVPLQPGQERPDVVELHHRRRLSSAYNMRPDFLTIQLGEQNATIVKLITDCFDKVKDHDFTGAQRLRGADPGEHVALDEPQEQLHDDPAADQDHGLAAAAARRGGGRTTRTRIRSRSTSSTRSRSLCVPLIDTIPTCSIRWAQLPPALLGCSTRSSRSSTRPEGRHGALPGRSERQPLGLRRHVPEVQGPLHDDEGQDQDQGRAPRAERSASTTTTRPR